ncbi:FRAS1-related extracellular matrix protein 2-like [Homarus americanus]|uniref:FRAS1-related extracellular matrix protein 2-like n=1 Tax=Homarus americanus TaxID=6706 RepID=UPI001C44AC25|nr:FRAS1-related extracellular matrix protein 2-like [Homarus americanus]
MSELMSQCGGQVSTDQVTEGVQSSVGVSVPLYVTYAFLSPAAATADWQHTDLSTQLRMSFVYDTSILWQQGIGAPVTSDLQGTLYPTSMKVRRDGRLLVTFRTQARFHGTFVEHHRASDSHSQVTSADHPNLTFTLDLIRSQPTYTQPEQHWQVISDYAVRDYSGTYVVHLLTCTATTDLLYTLPLVCDPRDLLTFDLQVRFQQVSDPVSEEFTLNTRFQMMRQRSLWLSHSTTDIHTHADVSFYPGDRIYGRVMVDPVQTLGDGFHLTLDQCFVCTGVDGYIPKYTPHTDEYGCVAESSSLLYNFKIIDRGSPESVRLAYGDVGFEAHLAEEDPEPDVTALLKQPGVDGFYLDSSPLFLVSHGRQWFVHCIYTVRPEENAARGLGKRDVSGLSSTTTHHHVLSTTPHVNTGQEPLSSTTDYQTLLKPHHNHGSHAHNASGAFDERRSPHAPRGPRAIKSPSGRDRRVKRSREDTAALGDEGRGTNMYRLSLQLVYRDNQDPSLTDQDSEATFLTLVVTATCVLVMVTSVAAAVFVRSRRRLRQDSGGGGKMMGAPGYMVVSGDCNTKDGVIGGHVIETRYYHTYEEESTEV